MPLVQFEPRFFEEILQDMVNYVRTASPEITDFNIGSRIRTLLEAVAMEDDEQYHQMVNVSLLWNLDNLRGTDLEERLNEWNIFRLSALSSTGEVIVSNNNLITSFLTQTISVGDTSSFLLSSAGFPTTGFPYTIRIGEGTTSVEDVSVTANSPSAGVLTHGALVNDHAVGERISLVDGASIPIPAGTRVRVPATDLTLEQTGTMTETATILPGNYDSNGATVVMDSPGIQGNVAAGAIKEFVGSTIFDGALVRNDGAFVGGRDVESDDQFRARGRKKIQALARATLVSLEQLVIGLEFTGSDARTWRVISARVREILNQTCDDRVDLYVWAGNSGFVTNETITDEDLTTASEDGQKFFRLVNTAIVPQTLVLQRSPVALPFPGTTLTQNTDYFLNEGTGWIEIADPGLSTGDQLRAVSYNHYTGLINQVQIAVNGVARNPTVYPGINAAGVKTLVTFPRPVTLDPIQVSIQVNPGFSEDNVAPLVAQAITQYFTELQIGDDIILAEIIERSMGVEGMFNVQVISPTQDITLLEDEVLDLDLIDIIVS